MAILSPEQRVKTTREGDAVEEKMEHPDRVVSCPRCGGILEYREVGNSRAVECKTVGCLYSAERGI
ncbi:MAG: hypothetical protein LBN05_00360 [Oscillospiraceae bacterium]|nr:hypothetical protein [Oscillospiraceae bacterium]